MKLIATVALGLCIGLATVPAMASHDCAPCTVIDGSITPMAAFQTISGDNFNGPKSYEFCAVGGGQYTFTFCSNGGGASYDTALSVHAKVGAACDPGTAQGLACNDDTCGLLSEIVWTAPADGQYIVKVSAFGSATGTFTLAYAGPPCVVPVEGTTWGAIKAVYGE